MTTEYNTLRIIFFRRQRIGLLVFVFFLFSFFTFAQSSFLPKNLGEDINSTYAEINPVISPDGNTLYFTKIIPSVLFGELDKQEIWYTQKQADGSWGKSMKLQHLNIGRYNSVLSITGDGQTMLINGVYNKKGNLWKKRGLSTVKKVGEEWGVPEMVKIKGYSKQNKGVYSNASMSFDGNYLLLAFTKSYNRKKLDIYISQKKGNKWSKPKRLKSPVNTKKRSEEAPFLSADNQSLYFTRKSKTNASVADIYVSKRVNEGWKKWSSPQKLSDTINSLRWDSYFKTDFKGSHAYFSSDNNSKGWGDIFVVKLFEENPYVLVKGFVLNSSNSSVLSPNHSFKIMVDGKLPDSVKIYPDSAAFALQLPFGKAYTLEARVDDFISYKDTLDLSDIDEFTVRKQNLIVAPFPYVLVRGKLLIQGSDASIEQLNPKIAIDGQEVDSIEVNPLNGFYSFKIPFGKVFKIKPMAQSYQADSRILDLSDVKEYKVFDLNLTLAFIKEKSATVKGLIIDKKRNKPIITDNEVKIFVNGEAVNATVDIAAGRYELQLPLGKSYTINASIENYYPVVETIDLKNETEDIRVLKDLSLVPIEVGQSVRLNNIFFNSGKTILKKESYPELDRVVQFLIENQNIVIEIGGHTDNIGGVSTNMTLSIGRAKAVARYLIAQGVDPSQVSSKGYGVTKPVGNNKTAAGRALNRRVEFTILKK